MLSRWALFVLGLWMTVALACPVLDGRQAAADDASSLLTSAELRELLAGNTEVGTYLYAGEWVGYREHFAKDGSVIGVEEDGTAYTGSWTIKEDRICTDYDTDESNCWSYRPRGDGGFETFLDNGEMAAQIERAEPGSAL